MYEYISFPGRFRYPEASALNAMTLDVDHTQIGNNNRKKKSKIHKKSNMKKRNKIKKSVTHKKSAIKKKSKIEKKSEIEKKHAIERQFEKEDAADEADDDLDNSPERVRKSEIPREMEEEERA